MNEKHALPTAAPEETGIPSKALIRFVNSLESKELYMHSFLAVRFGKIIAEGYWKPFNKEKKHRIYSCSKSFVSIAIGLLIEEGKLTLNDKLVTHFPEKLPAEGVHPYIEKMTVRDLLTMASPHEKTTYKLMDIDDWVKTFFIYEPSHLPGTIFSYDTSATHVLSALIQKLSGMPLLDYLRPKLLDHVGFSEDAYCLTDPMGISCGGSGVMCTTRDFAKVALTCLHSGRFEGKQLIPESYLKEATSKQIENFTTGASVDERQGYGYKFWRLRNNAFAFIGMGSQLAICIPDKDFLLVTTADNQHLPGSHAIILNALWDEIYPYLNNKTLPQDDASFKLLIEKTDSLSLRTVEGGRGGATANIINGKKFTFDKNPMGFTNVSFEFNDVGGVMHYQKNTGSFSLSFGYGMNISQNFPEYNYECLTSGAWANDNTLNIASSIIGEYCAVLLITIYFKDETVTINMKNFAELFLEEYMGFASGKM